MYCINSIIEGGVHTHFLHLPAADLSLPLIVFLHGFPDNAFGWEFQLDALKNQFNIVAPFLSGTLNSEGSRQPPPDSNRLKSDLLKIITSVRGSPEQKIFIVSHDLGCFLSVSLIQNSELKISGLIHINGMGLDQFVGRRHSVSQWLKSAYVFVAQSKVITQLVRILFPKFLLNFIYSLSGLTNTDTIRQNHPRVLSGIGVYRMLLLRAFFYLQRPPMKIAFPTLFIWGKNDVFLNTPTLDEVNRFYRQATVRILDGGHWVLRSNEKQVNRILIKTLLNWSRGV